MLNTYFLAGGVTRHKQYYYLVNTTRVSHMFTAVNILYN